jgi:hypothetical protein
VQVNYYMPRLLPDHQIYVVAQRSDVMDDNSGGHPASVSYDLFLLQTF